MKKDEFHVTVDNNLSLLIDFFRWFSALLVVLSHSRTIFFVPWGKVAEPTIANKILYFISASADYGVLMFFAISGYLIGGGVLEKMKKRNFQLTPYLINRFSRIYIVLFPALLLVWLLDGVGTHYLNELGIYTKAYDIGALRYSTTDSLTVRGFFYNLFMLQGDLAPTFGTANQLWSLNWEWWSYLLAPVLIGMFVRFPKRYMAYAFALSIGAIMSTEWGFLLLWHLGILLSLIHFRHKLALVLSVSLCLALPFLTRSQYLPVSFGTQTAFLVSFVVALSQLKHIRLPKFFTSMPHKWLASFSYSLYIIHTTILMFVMASMQSFLGFPTQFQPTGFHYLTFVAFNIAAYLVSYLFARFTEYNTPLLRKRLNAFAKNLECLSQRYFRRSNGKVSVRHE